MTLGKKKKKKTKVPKTLFKTLAELEGKEERDSNSKFGTPFHIIIRPIVFVTFLKKEKEIVFVTLGKLENSILKKYILVKFFPSSQLPKLFDTIDITPIKSNVNNI